MYVDKDSAQEQLSEHLQRFMKELQKGQAEDSPVTSYVRGWWAAVEWIRTSKKIKKPSDIDTGLAKW